ncbi:MAG: hypothetical protein GWP10_13535 [Nitrospiraceae bacterium]|nr:hypothetical protein [Nitrospiraceae bacterium]
MGHYIIYHRNAYNIYSTIIDNPLFEEAITLEQLIQYTKEKYGTTGVEILHNQVKRACKNGTNGLIQTSLEETVSLNHASKNGTHMLTAEFIKKFLTLNNKK